MSPGHEDHSGDERRPGDSWFEDPSDPVARFFARERAEVRSEPAGDLRWQRIVHEARPARRWRWTGYVAGVAAAAVVGAVAGAAIVTGGRFSTPDVTAATSGPSHSQTSGPTLARQFSSSAPSPSGSPGVPSTSPGQGEGVLPTAPPPPSPSAARPVPDSFTATSLSNSGESYLYAMGSSDCGDRRCPTLVGSQDDGATWHTVHVFHGAQATDPAAAQGRGHVPPADALSQVRFADPRTGWVYGGGLKLTRDGGRTWHDYAHPGQTVVDLETDGHAVAVATTSNCGGDGLCRGPLQLSMAFVTATGIAQPVADVAGGGVLAGAQVQAQGGRFYVEPEWAAPPSPDGSSLGVTGAARLAHGGLAALAEPPGCAGSPLRAVAPSADPSGRPTLFALCGGPTRWQVQRSGDEGRTWQVVGDRLGLPAGAGVSLAASDARHLVAATVGGVAPGADRAVALQVSSDGGRTWHLPARPPGRTGEWAWVGAPGGRQFYALSGSDGSYWRSVDDGEHWQQVSFLTAAPGTP